MRLSSKQIGLVHLAKKRVGMTDDDYRSMLRRVAGVETSADLDAIDLDLVMAEFRRLGFESTGYKATFGYRRGMVTPAKVALIRRLWSETPYADGSERSLNQWLERYFKASSLRFLDAEHGQKAIGALKAMVAKKEELRA